MKNIEKYQGIIPAFYACYDENGAISTERTKQLTRYFIEKGVKGVYVCGSSGECIYQSKEERKQTLEAVMSEAKGKLTVIAHVACNKPPTAWSWQHMPKAWALTLSRRSRPSTSTCPTMPSLSIGTTFPLPPPTPTLSSTTFLSWQALRLPCLCSAK